MSEVEVSEEADGRWSAEVVSVALPLGEGTAPQLALEVFWGEQACGVVYTSAKQALYLWKQFDQDGERLLKELRERLARV